MVYAVGGGWRLFTHDEFNGTAGDLATSDGQWTKVGAGTATVGSGAVTMAASSLYTVNVPPGYPDIAIEWDAGTIDNSHAVSAAVRVVDSSNFIYFYCADVNNTAQFRKVVAGADSQMAAVAGTMFTSNQRIRCELVNDTLRYWADGTEILPAAGPYKLTSAERTTFHPGVRRHGIRESGGSSTYDNFKLYVRGSGPGLSSSARRTGRR